MVKSLTSTNAVIQLKDDNTAELLNVSRQRLSQAMATATPWVGHSGKLRKRRRVFNRLDKQAATDNQSVEDQSEGRAPDNVTVTRHGHLVKKPARFHIMNSPGTIHKKEGEVVRSHETQREITESGERAERVVGAKTPHGQWLD